MFSSSVFWLWFAGAITLLAGLFAARKSVAAAKGLEKLVAFGPVFYAAPLATFGAEHYASAKGISQMIPAWMPAHLFWTYFVGTALILAALSIIFEVMDYLAAALVGVMFLCFVAMIHLPNAIAQPGNRFLWTVALREIGFAGGAFALASRRMPRLKTPARVMVSVVLLFFAVEHFLHPQFAPGVPLPKETPGWVPLRAFWGYLTAVALAVAGVLALVDREGRRAHLSAALLGLLVTLIVLFLYLPIFLTDPQQLLVEGANYVFDTLLFAGTVLLLAASWGRTPVLRPASTPASAAA